MAQQNMGQRISAILLAGLILAGVALLYQFLPEYRFWIVVGMIVGLARR